MILLDDATKTQCSYNMYACLLSWLSRLNISGDITTIQNGRTACQGQIFELLLPPEN